VPVLRPALREKLAVRLCVRDGGGGRREKARRCGVCVPVWPVVCEREKDQGGREEEAPKQNLGSFAPTTTTSRVGW